MLDYYIYLWKITWLDVLAVSSITIFIIARLLWKVGNDLKRYKRWGRLLIIPRVGFWLGILGAYLLMFNLANPDWFDQPGVIQGEIQGKSLTNSSANPYSIQVKRGTEPLTLWVDYQTYKTLNIEDQVKIKALPNHLIVYQCEVLP
ncbi:hypothetical protein [Desulfitobacterium sp.]|uniref:hypothetical protein n=1 Tax=Desulfitobacterium sp. TaxID=49981 RepID=UPI002BB7B013|nr:hypothetical protein [Desulfitobacterium sp.]HVJ50141.1 hypothetical protein [Desulfitobacterium sp.]